MLHVREIVTNDGDDIPWQIDTSKQLASIPGEGTSRALFVNSDVQTLPTVTVARHQRRVLDFYFPLPDNLRDAGKLPHFDLLWQVQTPERVVSSRTSFDRVAQASDTGYGDAYPYGYPYDYPYGYDGWPYWVGYGPYWWYRRGSAGTGSCTRVRLPRAVACTAAACTSETSAVTFTPAAWAAVADTSAAADTAAADTAAADTANLALRRRARNVKYCVHGSEPRVDGAGHR